MKHRVAGRKLGRRSEHRLALLRNLASQLFSSPEEKIRTTLMKAKEVRPFAERLITLAKRETLHARRLVLRHVHDPKVVGRLFDTLSARYAQRPGGYTRVLRLGPRRGDDAEMALLELVGAEGASAPPKDDKAPKKKTRGRGAAEAPAATKPARGKTAGKRGSKADDKKGEREAAKKPSRRGAASKPAGRGPTRKPSAPRKAGGE